jgi:hypothetical protein
MMSKPDASGRLVRSKLPCAPKLDAEKSALDTRVSQLNQVEA